MLSTFAGDVCSDSVALNADIERGEAGVGVAIGKCFHGIEVSDVNDALLAGNRSERERGWKGQSLIGEDCYRPVRGDASDRFCRAHSHVDVFVCVEGDSIGTEQPLVLGNQAGTTGRPPASTGM